MTGVPHSSCSGSFSRPSEREACLHNRLEKHVSMLAERIGERNLWHYEGLDASAHYIERVLKDLGYEVQRQEFTVEGMTVANVEGERTGTSLGEEILVIGAHYDSVVGSPGANDNASGVAGILEIARLLATKEPARTIRFVAFANEEPPFFQTDYMGSRVYASRSRRRQEQIVAMLAIETIGYYSDAAGSQGYPFPLHFFYPNTANFIGFVGNVSSRDLLHRVLNTFRQRTDFPAEGIAAPAWVTGISWSDHWSFWEEGYPAVMVTDTALFRYEHYHTPQDTPNKLVYDRMAQVVTGIGRVVADLAGTDTE